MSRALRDTLILAGAPAAIALVVLVAGIAMARTSPADAPSEIAPEQWWPVSECYTTTVVPVGGSGVAGGALLCVAADAIRPALYATGLPPGRAYSVWLLSFDRLRDRRPESLASDGPFSPDRADAFGQLGGGVVARNGDAHLQGHFDDRPLAGGSEVTLLLITHGVADDAPASVGRPRLLQPSAAQAPELGGAAIGNVIESRLDSVVAYAIFRLP